MYTAGDIFRMLEFLLYIIFVPLGVGVFFFFYRIIGISGEASCAALLVDMRK